MEVQRHWKYIHRLEADREWLRHINGELLAACEFMQKYIDMQQQKGNPIPPAQLIKAISAAIEKAKGGAA